MTASVDHAWIERIRRAPSPLLRRELERAGIEPARFRAEDRCALRPIAAAELDLDALDDPVGALRLADAPPPVRLGASDHGDTTVVLSWTARDLRRSAESGARALAAAGVRPGMKVANTLEGGLATPGSLGVGDAVEALGALDVPLGPCRDARSGDAAWALLDRVAVDALILDRPGAAGLLAKLRVAPPRAWRVTLWLGLDRPEDFPAWRRWVAVPEVALFTALDCEAGEPHVADDVHAEIVDDRLVVGALGGDAPLLRFATGFAAALASERCRCGRATLRADFRASV